MSTTPGRRRRAACLFSMREKCPFRKLKKSKSAFSGLSCGKSHHKGPVSNNAISIIYNENYHPSAPPTPYCNSHQQASPTAMDAEAVPPVAGFVSSGSVSSASYLINVHQNILSTSNMSMDLDSAVDPETGERAQG